MTWNARLRERLAADGIVPSAHADAIDEIAEHLNDIHRGAIRQGMTADAADAVVEAELARMGPLAIAVGERARTRAKPNPHESDWRSGIVADFRHAIRALKLNRGFSTVVIATLGIGIGGCTAVFSIINAMLLAPLPYPDPGRLVLVWETAQNDPARRNIVSAPVYEDWKNQNSTLESIGIFEYRTFNVASAAEPEQVAGIRASHSLFDVLAVPPAMGRTFTADEDQQGHKVVVISDGVWRTHLGGDPNAIGKSVRLNSEPFEVIGVMPKGFSFPRKGNGVWVPMAFNERDRERNSHSFLVAARTRPDATFESARADIERIGGALAQRYPENQNEGSTITLMSDTGVATLKSMLTALMGAVSLILLIGCVNVANLQLGRALSRQREFVVRLSLGAGMARLARQLFAESIVLAGAGALAGIALAWAATRSMDLVLTPNFRSQPYRGEVFVTVDLAVMGFALVIALVSALLFGFAPLVGLRRREPQALLRDGERGSTGVANVARRVLVTVEVALAIVVLSGAGLMIKSLNELFQVNPGLDPQHVLTLQVSLPQEDTYGPPVRKSFCRDLAESGSGIGGIRGLGAISHLPFSGDSAGRGLTIEGQPNDPNSLPSAAYRLTCPGYFAALGIPLIEGRDFTHADRTDGEPVAIINRAMAERFWPGKNPVGLRFKIGPLTSRQPWRLVVGVAENARHFGFDTDITREFFLPYAQNAWPVMTVVAKTDGEPALQQTALREIIRRVDPDLPIARMQPMENIVSSSVNWRAIPMRLLTGFAIIGLLLASLGVYGVLAYYVSLRTREIGVRSALGATRGQLVSMVLRQSVIPLAAGAVLGVAGSFGSGRWLNDLLYHVQPSDPVVIAVIVSLLMVVGLFASWLPARRAAAIDPLSALRED